METRIAVNWLEERVDANDGYMVTAQCAVSCRAMILVALGIKCG